MRYCAAWFPRCRRTSTPPAPASRQVESGERGGNVRGSTWPAREARIPRGGLVGEFKRAAATPWQRDRPRAVREPRRAVLSATSAIATARVDSATRSSRQAENPRCRARIARHRMRRREVGRRGLPLAYVMPPCGAQRHQLCEVDRQRHGVLVSAGVTTSPRGGCAGRRSRQVGVKVVVVSAGSKLRRAA